MTRAASFGSFFYPYKKMNKIVRGNMPPSQKETGSLIRSGMTDSLNYPTTHHCHPPPVGGIETGHQVTQWNASRDPFEIDCPNKSGNDYLVLDMHKGLPLHYSN